MIYMFFQLPGKGGRKECGELTSDRIVF